MIAKVLWHTEPGKIELKALETGKPEEGSVLIRSKYSFISQGTESLINRASVPKELYQTMRVNYMQGNFDLPCTYGYSLVGEIISGPEDLVGKNVHVMHPHQDLCHVRIDDLFELSERTNLRMATLISNMETAINACWDGQIKKEHHVLVIGYGSIGALAAHAAAQIIPKQNIVIFEKDGFRSTQAGNHGFRTNQGKVPFDVAFNTSTSEDGLQMAIDLVKNEGTVVEMSWYGTNTVHLKLGLSFHYGRKKIISSQVSHIPPHMASEWTFKKRKSLALKYVSTIHKLDFNEVEFSSLEGNFDKMRSQHIYNIIKY